LLCGFVFCLLGLLSFLATSAYNTTFFPQKGFNPYLGPLVLGGLFFVLGISLMCAGFMVYSVPDRILYAITDRRIIILCGGRERQVASYSKRAIAHIHCIERPDGSGDLFFFGNANDVPSHSKRLGTFATISSVRQVEQLLLEMFEES
jgi:hypothetical protein